MDYKKLLDETDAKHTFAVGRAKVLEDSLEEAKAEAARFQGEYRLLRQLEQMEAAAKAAKLAKEPAPDVLEKA